MNYHSGKKDFKLKIKPIPYYSHVKVISSHGGSDTAFVDKDGHNCPADCTDIDGDGYGCTGPDCDDNDATVNPGAAEILYNGKTDDCNAATLDDDLDGDGYPSATDCDDNNATVNPGATEICENGIDENCDGQDDVCSGDIDGDGYTVADGDCDDSDPQVNPGVQEGPSGSSTCSDGKDNDCDYRIDAYDFDC